MNGHDELIKPGIPFRDKLEDTTAGKELGIWLNYQQAPRPHVTKT